MLWEFFNLKLKLFICLILATSMAYLGFYFFAVVNASDLSYSEDFTTTTFKNSLYTTANWLGTGFVDLSKAFVRADGTKNYIDDVSEDQEVSSYPLIFLDNKNQPYVAWESTPSGLNSEIYFTKGNLMTLNWEQMSGTVGRDNVSHTIGSSNIDRVAVASDGNPFIVWQDNTLPGLDGIYGNGDDVQGTANDYSILFSQWNTNTNAWSKMDGSLGIEKISTNPVGSPARLPRIVLDSLDRPYIVWDEQVSPTNNEIYFTRWDGTKWAKMNGAAGVENLSNTLGESSFPRILLDANNRPQVIWEDATPGNNEIFFTKWSPSAGTAICGAGVNSCWTDMSVSNAGNENISNTAGDSNYDRQYDSNFVIGHNNFPYIAWRDNTGAAFYNLYFSHWNGTAWSSMDTLSSADVFNTGANTSRPQLVVDTTNNPQIAWLSGANRLYFSHWNSGASQWQWLDGTPGNQVVDNVTVTFPTMEIDSANNLFISWLRSNPKNVAAVRSTGSNWTKLDGTAGFSDVSGSTIWSNNRPQMVLAPDGNLFFTWETGTGSTNPEIWTTFWDNDLQAFRNIREGKEQSAGLVGENHWVAQNMSVNFDAANTPFIIWNDQCHAGSSLIDVCLTHWDGTKWAMMDGSAGTDQVFDPGGYFNQSPPELLFDSTRTKPYMAWTLYAPPITQIWFTRWDGANFVAMDGTVGAENVGNLNSLNGFPSTGKSMMVLDPADNPYLVAAGNSLPALNEEINFTKWTPGAGALVCGGVATDCWTNMAGDTAGFENISNDLPISYSPTMLLDSSNNPLVLWLTGSGGSTDISFSKWTPGAGALVCGGVTTDCWTNMAGTVAGSEKINTLTVQAFAGFVLDSTGKPFILWQENNNSFLTHWNGAAWSKMDGTAGRDIIVSGSSVGLGQNVLEFDSLDNPYIVWENNISGNGEIYFTHWDGSKFATMSGAAGSENISNTSGHSHFPFVLIDSANNPAIFWRDYTDAGDVMDIFFTKWDGSGWINMRNQNSYTNVSRNAGTNGGTAYNAILDGNDNFNVAFDRQESGINNLYFSRTGIPTNFYRTAQSTNVYSGSESVTQATLSSVSDNNGGVVDIKYYLSNDGGFIWEPATVGVPINFTSNTFLEWRARLLTTDPAIIPTITGLSINYVTASGGGFTNTPPSAPIDLTCQAQSTDTIRWNFTDTANPPNSETGFRLYGPNGFIADTGNEIVTDISYLDETNLTANILANDRYVTAFSGQGESPASNTASCFTLANTPLNPLIGAQTENSIVVKLDPNDDNPANTEYAIKELNSNQYVNPDGTFSLVENWQTYASWGGDNGVVVNGEPLPETQQPLDANINAQFNASLTSATIYNFAVKARNGDGIETAFSGTTSGTTASAPSSSTAPQILAAKGVAINLAKNGGSNFAAIKSAQAASGFVENQSALNDRMMSFLEQLAVFLVFVLILLVIFLIIGLISAINHLNKNESLGNKFKLVWHILTKEPAFAFSQNVKPDPSGTYEISYNKLKSFHNFSQKNFKRILGVAFIDMIMLVVILYNFNHNSSAQNVPYDQSGQEVSVQDKLSYVVEISNTGTETAANVIVSDILNVDLSYVSNSAKIIKDGQVITTGISINNNNLDFNIGNLGVGQSSEVYFSAMVDSGSEGKTITNQAQINGDNFAIINTNITSNLVKSAVAPLCGNNKIDIDEQCDASASPNGCGSNQNCVNCQCQNIPAVAVCGNGLIETGESCDPQTAPNGCALGEVCSNCQCLPEVVVPPAVPPPPLPPVTPPGITPPGENVTPPGIIPTVTSILQNRQLEDASQNIITPLLLALIALNTIPSAIALTLNILPYLHLIFSEPLLLLFRKKRKKWGIIYDALTKLPVGLAVVRLYSKTDKKLIQTKVTDKDGRYILIVKELGRYYLSVTKPGYEFPTRYLKNDTQDLKYLDLYHGEEIEVKEKEGVVTANIPLDPVNKMALTEKEAVRSYVIKNTRLIVAYSGIILALLVVLIYPTIITIGALSLHIIMFLIFRTLIVPPKPKSWGIVYDQASKKPLGQALVRIFETRFNKLLETQVTDSKGRYAFLVGQNKYQLLTEKQGYQNKEIKDVDLVSKEQIVNLDMGLEKIK
ncbi:MAG: hypothetical protein WC460_06390 [Patescibacteria group bacterium]